MRTKPIVAIDGPAGSGKSTVARQVAERLGFFYVDTGAMYRAIALLADRQDALSDGERLGKIAHDSLIELGKGPDGAARVRVNGEDVSEAIRSPRVSQIVSPVAAYPQVRTGMVKIQRRLGDQGGIVMEGRDIQTVVFPDAEVKIFLTASVAERARRRWRELADRGQSQNPEEVESQIRERDLRDSSRTHSPLAAASDAVLVDTDGLTITEVVDRIVEVVREAMST